MGKFEQEGDHTLGIRGSMRPHFTADYHQLGKIPGWKQPTEGVAPKHCHHSTPLFPDVPHPDPGGTYKKKQEGDESLGFASKEPHFTSTYSFHGRIPGFNDPGKAGQYKRYDFGPVANTQYRLTEWGRDDED